MTFELNADALVLKLDSLQEALLAKGQSGDAVQIVKGEVKQLSRTIVNFIPPLGSGGKEIGEHAVEVGIRSVFSEASPELIDEIGAHYGIRDVTKAWITNKDNSRVSLSWDNIDPLGDRIAEYHGHYRDPRTGKTPPPLPKQKGSLWAARVVVPSGTLQPYIDKVKQRVGMWKATWAFPAAQLGHHFARWISRHFGNIGDLTIYREDLNDPLRPSITIGSRFPGNFKMQSSIEQAIKVRSKAVKRRIELILSDYARQFNSGSRVTSAATRVAPEEVIDQ